MLSVDIVVKLAPSVNIAEAFAVLSSVDIAVEFAMASSVYVAAACVVASSVYVAAVPSVAPSSVTLRTPSSDDVDADDVAFSLTTAASAFRLLSASVKPMVPSTDSLFSFSFDSLRLDEMSLSSSSSFLIEAGESA